MKKRFAYVGGYTTEKRGGLGKGGINVFEQSGQESWKLIQTFELMNPTYLTNSRNGRFLYSVMGDGYTISAFAIGPDGKLSLIDQKESGYMNGVYCETSPDDKFLIVSSCSLVTKCGAIQVFRLKEDGTFGELCSETIPEGRFGPLKGTQEGAKPHQTRFDGKDEFLLECDKALDQVNTYRLQEDGTLQLHSTLQWRPASCPRHIAFHPDGRMAYLLTEWVGTIVVCRYENGVLSPIEVQPTLPPDYVGLKNTAAEIEVHPNGKWLYASNREQNSIVRFGVSADGHLSDPVWIREGNKKARFFTLSKDGEWLYCANEKGHNVTIFKVDSETGTLSLTEETLEGSAPSCIIIQE